MIKVKHTKVTYLEAPTVVKMIQGAQLQHLRDQGYGKSKKIQHFKQHFQENIEICMKSI